MKASIKKKALFGWYRAVHVWVCEELQDVFVLPTQECGEHCTQRACIHTTCNECNISDLAILLRGWNFASGSMAVASCFVTSCLLNKAEFNCDSVNNTHNSHVWADENPHTTVESNFQIHFSVNVWCAILDDQLIDPFILEGRLTGEVYLRFLQEELPHLLEDVPLNKRGCVCFQHNRAPPHSSREVRNFLNSRFPGWWIGRGSPHNWPARSPDLSPLDYCVWDGWKNWFTVWRW